MCNVHGSLSFTHFVLSSPNYPTHSSEKVFLLGNSATFTEASAEARFA